MFTYFKDTALNRLLGRKKEKKLPLGWLHAQWRLTGQTLAVATSRSVSHPHDRRAWRGWGGVDYGYGFDGKSPRVWKWRWPSWAPVPNKSAVSAETTNQPTQSHQAMHHLQCHFIRSQKGDRCIICVFRCKRTPALLAEWPGSFAC